MQTALTCTNNSLALPPYVRFKAPFLANEEGDYGAHIDVHVHADCAGRSLADSLCLGVKPKLLIELLQF
jgi:hypothetical protein